MATTPDKTEDRAPAVVAARHRKRRATSFGGPFGAEGPIIMTCGAFGSMIAQPFYFTRAERKTLKLRFLLLGDRMAEETEPPAAH